MRGTTVRGSAFPRPRRSREEERSRGRRRRAPLSRSLSHPEHRQAVLQELRAILGPVHALDAEGEEERAAGAHAGSVLEPLRGRGDPFPQHLEAPVGRADGSRNASAGTGSARRLRPADGVGGSRPLTGQRPRRGDRRGPEESSVEAPGTGRRAGPVVRRPGRGAILSRRWPDRMAGDGEPGGRAPPVHARLRNADQTPPALSPRPAASRPWGRRTRSSVSGGNQIGVPGPLEYA